MSERAPEIQVCCPDCGETWDICMCDDDPDAWCDFCMGDGCPECTGDFADEVDPDDWEIV